MSPLIGLEILFSTINVRNQSDAVVAVVHWSLITQGFLCVGKDDEAKVANDSVPTEHLPEGWNSDSDVYTLKYISDIKTVVIVKVIKVENVLLVSALVTLNNEVHSTSISVKDHVGEECSNHRSAFLNLTGLYQQLKTDILNKLKPESPFRVSDNPGPKRESNSPTRERRTLVETQYPIAQRERYEEDPLAVGGRDLDPLGHRQGGMLMDPRGLLGPRTRPSIPFPGGLPRGSVPPGARFDPFGPPIPDADRRRNPGFGAPNPDHLPPPGYDDMFL